MYTVIVDSWPKDKLSLMQAGSNKDTGVLGVGLGITAVNYNSMGVSPLAKNESEDNSFVVCLVCKLCLVRII